VRISPALRAAAVLLVAALAGGCLPGPTPEPSTGATGPTAVPSLPAGESPAPTASPEPTIPSSFPLAVVTGLTNLKATITVDELTKLAAGGSLAIPCGVEVTAPTLATAAACVPADGIAAALAKNQKLVALLPPGLVEPSTKVLPFAGDGPYGLFGADLFGDPTSRALPYPVQAKATGSPPLDPAWTAYDPAQVWTMTSVGSMCSDRGAAHQAVTLGKGWDWVFKGGTADYRGKPIPNPAPPPGITRELVVRPFDTGNAGATAEVISRADVTLADLKCPILPNSKWHANDNTTALNFSVPEAVVSRWKNTLGVDVIYLPADHQSDKGLTGIKSTLSILDKNQIPHSGEGLNLDQALTPAIVEVAGLKIAFVSWNNVPGPTHASATTAGVAWLTQGNVSAAVGKAKAAGADVIICDPQWWGPDEYVHKLTSGMQRAVGWMDAAGCSQIVGGGLHVSGPLNLRSRDGGVSMVLGYVGNFLFGQDWWQDTQEGTILDATFVGTRLVNVRLIPYVMLLSARPSLLDPEGAGHYVLQRIYKNSDLDYGS
jgi:Bacterial capsule synthesis protein PGA_cap